MTVERKDNEILVRLSGENKLSRIQSILDYLRYEELTAKSKATQKELNLLLKESKKGRFNKIKKEMRLDD